MGIDVLATLSKTRREVLALLKRTGAATIVQMADELGMTHEGVRAHVVDLQQEGWIRSDCDAAATVEEAQGMGRPPARYCLTVAGDHTFPKRYDHLAVILLDALQETVDERGLREFLANVTDIRVAALKPAAGKSLKDKLEALTSIYLHDDPYFDVRRSGRDIVLIERNCPFLDVALQRPAICSTTVSAMRRVLGYRIVRDHRFQDDEARCEFRVLTDQPLKRPRRFEIEPPKDAAKP